MIGLPQLLNRSIDDISYDDVTSFLETKEPEGIRLDYKQEINPRSLRKQFAAFSNKYGGIILIGVEEQEETGIPIPSVGIKITAQDIESLHQVAANTDPLPNYAVKKVEEDGKGFIFIRILRGDTPPYFLINDSNIYVRTGNISTDYLDKATSEELRKLFKTKEEAEMTRIANKGMVRSVFNDSLEESERNRIYALDQGKSVFPQALDKNAVWVEHLVQPSNPDSEIISPYQLGEQIEINRVSYRSGTFPFASLSFNPYPFGVNAFDWNRATGSTWNTQVLSNGSVYFKYNAIASDRGEDKLVQLSDVSSYLILNLLFSLKLLRENGYSGSICSDIYIWGIKNKTALGAIPQQGVQALREAYSISTNTNTLDMEDINQRTKVFKEIVKKLHWHLGMDIDVDSQRISSLISSLDIESNN